MHAMNGLYTDALRVAGAFTLMLGHGPHMRLVSRLSHRIDIQPAASHSARKHWVVEKHRQVPMQSPGLSDMRGSTLK